ncbi:MAG TPA: hypothetical protein VL361_04780 [Candidatus Limnocylindrales bacterium]|nr:hypothetical protein [Candidatus Limnocylindrales bacterium]
MTNPPFSKVWQIGDGITNQYVDLLVLTALAYRQRRYDGDLRTCNIAN